MTQDKMISKRNLCKLLAELELQMKQVAIWQAEPPNTEYLMSQQPFAMDRLEPSEWLQWVFIEKLRHQMGENLPIPEQFNVSPYFEQCWQGDSRYLPILLILKKIDKGEGEC
ncbi:YqcC family protein [Vibrio caribbeanicus]|nr:YqcC family protein [Vibrio caribbeanicus]